MISVLVADDEALERRAMRHILESMDADEPIEIREAINGIEALKLAHDRKPDIAFLDIRMPGMDGLGVAEQFSSHLDPPIVIMVTAYDYFAYARTALRFGVFDYLLKPASSEDVRSVFLRAFRTVAARRKEAAMRMAAQMATDIQRTLHADICRGLNSATVDDDDVRRLVALYTGGAVWACLAMVAGMKKGLERAASSIAVREFPRFFRALAERFLLGDLGLAGVDPLLFLSTPEQGSAAADTVHALIVIPEPRGERPANQILREKLCEGTAHFSQRCKEIGGVVFRFGIGLEMAGNAKKALQTAKIAFNLSNPEHPILLLDAAHEIGNARSSPDSVSARAVVWLQEHFMESIGIQDLARELKVSPSYLSRLLKRELGIGFGDTLARIRVAYAKEIIATGASAKEASFLVGFRDQSYFTKVFTKIEGLSPSQFVRHAHEA